MVEQDYPLGERSRGLWLLNVLLGVLASSISIGISALAGWQRGGANEHRLMLGAVGVMAVLGAHLLPSLLAQAKALVRILGLGFWMTLVLYVAYGHAAYYLAVVEQAGSQRAASLERTESTAAQAPRRMLSAILADKAKMEAAFALIAPSDCSESCAGLRMRQSALKARVMVIEAEADEARRWQQAHDRLEARRAALHDEPAVTQLATGLGVTPASVNLVTGAVFSVILEGVGCLCWYLVFVGHESGSPSAVIGGDTLGVTRGVSGDRPTEVAMTAKAAPPSELDRIVAQVSHEISAGRLVCKVKAIREHLGCGQGKASEVRRRLVAVGAAGTHI